MGRNLVVCCDGTSNSFKRHRTNVLKLCYALEKDPQRQLVYYHPGIGTRAPLGIGTAIGGWIGKVAGLAVGYGLKADIADAYIFLMNHFREGDRLFLFGFSRGAYTARVIASMLKLYGLSMRGNDALVPYAVDMLWSISRHRGKQRANEYFDLAEEYKRTLAAGECKPHFMGVWDTVNSVGWIGSPLAIPFSRRNPDIAVTRHAVAIDERRAFFRLNWLEETPGADIEQVWFPGSHCDIGGGHPLDESGLSNVALEWMAKEAAAAGLLIDEGRLAEVLAVPGCQPDTALPRPHRSITGFWILAEFVPKAWFNRKTGKRQWRMNLFRRRTIPAGACVHDAAWQIQDYRTSLPEGAVRLSRKGWASEAPDIADTGAI